MASGDQPLDGWQIGPPLDDQGVPVVDVEGDGQVPAVERPAIVAQPAPVALQPGGVGALRLLVQRPVLEQRDGPDCCASRWLPLAARPGSVPRRQRAAGGRGLRSLPPRRSPARAGPAAAPADVARWPPATDLVGRAGGTPVHRHHGPARPPAPASVRTGHPPTADLAHSAPDRGPAAAPARATAGVAHSSAAWPPVARLIEHDVHGAPGGLVRALHAGKVGLGAHPVAGQRQVGESR